jgi:hypothetical protein
VSIASKKWRAIAGLCLLLSGNFASNAQEPAGKETQKHSEKSAAAEKAADKASEKATLSFQIQLLETHIRFEANGDSRKEVHTIVRLNNAVGAHEFSKIAFDYNRVYQNVEIPMVRITHANGGTSEVLPSAVTDAVNPAAEKYPAYEDVRVKSVRLLGLQEGDSVEYRVTTTTTHAPLAPDFWLEHSFDRSGQVLEESYELDLPESRVVQLAISASTPANKTTRKASDNASRVVYTWHLSAATPGKTDSTSRMNETEIVLTTFASWRQLADRLGKQILPSEATVHALSAKAKDMVQSKTTADERINSIYDFVSQKITTIDLPLGTTGFHTREPVEILSSGYATPEDKFVLFAALSDNYGGPARAGLVSAAKSVDEHELPRPSVFDHLLTMSGYPSINFWMDLNLEVAPYRMIPSQFQRKRALLVGSAVTDFWPQVFEPLPFASFQKVGVNATLGDDGILVAKVKYTLRGQNELLLRLAFHQTPKEKWKDVAGLLALSDGFRGVITSVNASDPMATQEPFRVEYELKQAKFVDWAKKPVRIPALLPQIGLPDAAARKNGQIELGTPLDVETQVTLHLPAGTIVQAPAGTAVQRDYATYLSKYGATADTLTALRHIHFLLQEIPGDRAMDYEAFERVVQNDQSQYFVLDRGVGVKAAALQ